MTISSLHTAFYIKEIRTENYRTKTFILDAPLPGAQPGQFVMAWLPDVGEKPFSIAGADPLKLTVVAVGPFSQALHDLRPGDRIWARGPLGKGYQLSGSRHLLVGGGYGAAPLLFLAETALARGDMVRVCLGARSAPDILLVEAFKKAGAEVAVTTDDGSLGQRGLVTLAVAEALEAFAPDTLYACGPVAMLSALAVYCRGAGLPCQLSWEALMRCGIGLCGSCELPAEAGHAAGVPSGWLTCKDGPVFITK